MIAKFSFYMGAMGSGKSLDLIRTVFNYKEKGLVPLVYKPTQDTREGVDKCIISTRVGLTIEGGWIVSNINSMISTIEKDINIHKPNVILVDEAQFLSSEQVRQLKILSLKHNIPFIFYGLKVNFQGKLFEGTSELISLSENINELKTMCSCGQMAKQNVRIINNKPIFEGEEVAIEQQDINYISVCNSCFLNMLQQNQRSGK